MKIEISEKKLKAAIQIAFAECGLEDENLENLIIIYTKALSITAVVQAKPEVCEHPKPFKSTPWGYKVCFRCNDIVEKE